MSCGCGDERGGGRDRALRLAAAASPAGSMLSPKIRQARRGECHPVRPAPCGGTFHRARGNFPPVQPLGCGSPAGRSRPREGSGTAGVSGAYKGSGRMKRRRRAPVLVVTNIVCNVRAEQQG